MAKCNSSSLGVNSAGVDSAFFNAVYSLTSECLIDFIDIDITGLKSTSLEELGDSCSGADTHDFRGDTGNSVVNKPSEDGESEFLGSGSSGKEDGSSTIGNLR